MKPVNRKIDELKIKAILKAERNSALGSAVSSDLSEQRMRALDYYMGQMQTDMPAPDGQSSAVSTDVQDVVEGALPIILDAITGGDNVAEFKASSADDEAAARQETEYVNKVFYQDNDGFQLMYASVKDLLIQKNCFVKWWMEPDEARTREKYQGLDQAGLGSILADTDVEVVDLEQYEQPDPLNGGQPTTFYNCITERTSKKLRAKIAAFPPEEWLVSKNARTIKDAPYLAHLQRKPQADLIALYPDKEQEIRDAPAAVLSADNAEAFHRQSVQDNQDQLQTQDDVNKDMRLVEAAEHYVRLVLEADKVARKYKIVTVGEGAEILDIEEVPEWPVATGTAIIMPHRLFGRALADLAIDIQQVKTSLLRATLNNAYFANNQRLEISETHASDNTLDDILNNRVGGVVRTRMPGGLNPLPVQSIGGWVMPTIQYMDSIAERRTGIGQTNTGLDVDSLNHARPGAVDRIMGAAEMRIKLMTRTIIETLVVDIFRGLHGMLQQYSEEAEVVALTGGWVKVDPREWQTRRHMKVTLPLGGVSKQQMLGFFAQVLTAQKDGIMQQGGGNGPLVSYQGMYKTLDDMLRTAGLHGAQGYFMTPPPPNPNAPPPPNPKMVEAQANAQATASQVQAKQQLDQAQFQHDTQMELMKQQAGRQREQDEFAHKQMLDKAKFEHDAEMEQMKLGFKLRIDHFKATEEAKLNEQQARLDRQSGVDNV